MRFSAITIAVFSCVILAAAPDRLTRPVSSAQTKQLRGFVHSKVRTDADLGPADPSTPISYALLMLKPTPGLEAFLAQKQAPLTPEQFAQRFGASGNDRAKIVAWLESQGLQVNTVARGGLWIAFSGTAQSVGAAFHTQIHRFRDNGNIRFANISEPSIPLDLDSVVSGFHGLNNFGLTPTVRQSPVPVPDYNNSKGAHFIAPDDISTIYDVAPLYAMGIDGTGQRIAIAGSGDVDLADVRAFRTRFNLPPKDPKVMLFGPDPGKNPSGLVEWDLDMEWSGAMAPNATIVYVNSSDLFSSAFYAIDNAVAPILSTSFGACEVENTPDFRVLAQQAVSEGITWIASSGDAGAATCDDSSPTPQASKGLAVSFPASFPEVTAIGGTMFNEATGNYWAAMNGPNGGSALSYIPEVAWNESVCFNGPVGAGGGASAFYPKPFWQNGPGVPNDGARDVPDVSLNAAACHDSTLFYTSGALSSVGGTSVGTPMFAGIVALLNQYLLLQNAIQQPGLGNINPVLYRLAQTTSDVFHDITMGTNFVACAQGTPNCVNGLLGFSAGPGYDLATGLGSVDVFHMVTEWSPGTRSTTTLTATPVNANINDNVTLTATVTSAGTLRPTGTVTFLSSDNTLGTVDLMPGAGTSSVATLGTSEVRIAEGDGRVQALYSGDTSTSSSGATATVNLIIPTSGSLVVPSVDPNPVYQFGNYYLYTVTLQELAGVATKLTGFTYDGTAVPLTFFSKTTIPAFGFIQTTLENGIGITPTAGAHVFGFTGMDVTGGKTWSQQVTAVFLPSSAPAVTPSILLTSVPATVDRNLSAPADCQWSQQLTVQEQGGFLTTLTSLTAGTTNLTSQIQPIFGTTRLAPFGALYGNLCWSSANVAPTKTFTLVGIGEIAQVGSATTVTYAGAPAVPASFSLSRQSVLFSGTTSTTLDLAFTGGDSVWTTSILPANITTKWLSVTPASGEGPGHVLVQAKLDGLSNGVYRAFLTFQATNAFPQAINVPVTLVVGNSAALTISSISNAADGLPTGAPGAQMNVTGANLASSAQQTLPAPLDLLLAGVSATVNGISAPLYSVAPGQIVFQVPYETAPGSAVLAIDDNGQITYSEFPVAISAPGIYPSPGLTAAVGQNATIYITGEGDVTPTTPTGASSPAGTATSRLPHSRLPLSVTVGGTPAKVTFAGLPAGSVGVTQINFTVPAGTPAGVQPVVVTVGTNSSPAIALNVTAP